MTPEPASMAQDQQEPAAPPRTASRTSGNLKRVSFGSLKGSMVETLVYQDQGPAHELAPLLNGRGEEEEAWRVRVTLYEAQRPHLVSTPESPVGPDQLPLLAHSAANMASQPDGYVRQQSTESGLDNPFRPDGELSREADTIVSLIKEGKPITPVKGEPDGFFTSQLDGSVTHSSPQQNQQLQANGESKISPAKAPAPVAADRPGTNGSAAPPSVRKGVVEVQHGIVVPPSDSSTVEQVMIKKKPKCKCCVIQ
ncbi:uncharacterized protein LOC142557727 [Dermacentor variabilis]|uniref:uncharacterized protein LOC142557727 n=1 Tax=Dermacentor variabilis TaxID=34621 RepID=UPI003F5C98DB